MCTTEKRNELLKKPMLMPKDIAVLMECSHSTACRYIQLINRWLADNGRPILADAKGKHKKIRTVDYVDFAGLPRELMV